MLLSAPVHFDELCTLNSFPLSLSVDWHELDAFSLGANLKSWLNEPGSLTQRLKTQCHTFSVSVLSEKVIDTQAHHCSFLPTQAIKLRVREVLLICDDTPVVYAQSWIPTGQEDALSLTHLGQRPLGEVIFQDVNLRRDNLQVADFSQHTALCNLAESLNLPTHPLWGRRSCFHLTQGQIMVCEVFLPGAYAYL